MTASDGWEGYKWVGGKCTNCQALPGQQVKCSMNKCRSKCRRCAYHQLTCSFDLSLTQERPDTTSELPDPPPTPDSPIWIKTVPIKKERPDVVKDDQMLITGIWGNKPDIASFRTVRVKITSEISNTISSTQFWTRPQQTFQDLKKRWCDSNHISANDRSRVTWFFEGSRLADDQTYKSLLTSLEKENAVKDTGAKDYQDPSNGLWLELRIVAQMEDVSLAEQEKEHYEQDEEHELKVGDKKRMEDDEDEMGEEDEEMEDFEDEQDDEEEEVEEVEEDEGDKLNNGSDCSEEFLLRFRMTSYVPGAWPCLIDFRHYQTVYDVVMSWYTMEGRRFKVNKEDLWLVYNDYPLEMNVFCTDIPYTATRSSQERKPPCIGNEEIRVCVMTYEEINRMLGKRQVDLETEKRRIAEEYERRQYHAARRILTKRITFELERRCRPERNAETPPRFLDYRVKVIASSQIANSRTLTFYRPHEERTWELHTAWCMLHADLGLSEGDIVIMQENELVKPIDKWSMASDFSMQAMRDEESHYLKVVHIEVITYDTFQERSMEKLQTFAALVRAGHRVVITKQEHGTGTLLTLVKP